MGYTAAPLEKLIEEFSKFPGIGRKGATRMAYQVLSMSDAACSNSSCAPPRRGRRAARPAASSTARRGMAVLPARRRVRRLSARRVL